MCLSSALAFAVDTSKKVKVFILAGQSNMEGKAKMELLDYQVDAPETRDFFKHLKKDGKWVVRDDVWINFLNRKGNLTVGFGSPNCIGPELEFGNTVGDYFKEQVLIIKTAWGGKSIGRDFRPPSSGLPSEEKLNEILRKTNERNKKQKRPEITLDEVKSWHGKFYREMMKEISTTLAELKARFPDYKGQGYEIAGVVWFQGWNDMFDPDFVENYAKHMANFIRDVRKDLKAPNLPFVIGQMGQNGPDGASGNMLKIKDAQASMEKIPEFKGNVRVVKTDVFWDKKAAELVKTWRQNVDEWKKVGSDYGYHYLGSAITFSNIGRAFGQAILDLKTSEMPLVAHENFDNGLDRWRPTDKLAWKLVSKDGRTYYSLIKKNSNYKPKVRSPLNISLLGDIEVGDFVLDVDLRSTEKPYGHQSLCLFFGHQDATHFYYVHFGRKADAHANSIFLVNDAARVSIAEHRTKGTDFSRGWHRARIRREVETGRIEVYFDDMTRPVMTAVDKTFAVGRVGVGSFDDTGDFDSIRLCGRTVRNK
ncbi:MAG: hypothetical protein ISS79_11425 [Phycisphaerae bacterium]|nr:hypothetical protein [Phycisphaerae bacterium]